PRVRRLAGRPHAQSAAEQAVPGAVRELIHRSLSRKRLTDRRALPLATFCRLAILPPPRGSGLRPRQDADGREARMSGCTHTARWRRRILGLLGLIVLALPSCLTEP